MRNGLGYLIKLIVSILLLLYTETYFYKFINILDINISFVSQNIINLIIYTIMFIILFYLYKAEIKSAFNKFDNKIGQNIVYSLIAFVILFIFVILTNYVTKVLAEAFSVKYISMSFINIFNNPFNLDLIVTILKDIILLPTIKIIIFVLGVNNIFNSKSGIFFSALAYAVYVSYLIGGNALMLFINSLPYFAMFIVLSYIYKKNNNISFSIVTFILFNLLSSILMGKIV